MQSFGHRSAALLPAAWIALGVLAAVVPALWMWHFTVDDALISIRYARHLSSSVGWRFNAGGPSTDGVTPLPWPLILLPLTYGTTSLGVLARAKALGLVAAAATGSLLGRALSAETGAPVWARGAILATLGLSLPWMAYTVSGMETAPAALIATWAALEERPTRAAVLAGLAASLRPELVVWACALAVVKAARDGVERVTAAFVLALGPFLVCALVRAAVWGRPAPLALLAKPSDVAHGTAYALAALFVSAVPVVVLAPRTLLRARGALALVIAAIAHTAAIVAVGGDWMPYARLLVPIVPSLAYAGVLVAAHARPVFTATRCAFGLALAVLLLVRNDGQGRGVGLDREALVESARPWLASATRVAALDVGWVGAATDADIVDLAGVTDPEIAALPGGHTSKRVSTRILLDRGADALLLYVPSGLPEAGLSAWRTAVYPRMVEARLARDESVARHFAPAAWLPLGSRGAGYVLLRRIPPA